MSGLAVHRPAGRKADSDGRAAVSSILRGLGCELLLTPPDQPAIIDGLVVRRGRLIAAAEIRTRYDMTLGKLLNDYDGLWLVTASKVQHVVELAARLGLPAVVYLYLQQSGVVMAKQLSTPDGQLIVTTQDDYRETQEHADGGRIRRHNYLVQMRDAKKYIVPGART